jgi:hypothetical protein
MERCRSLSTPRPILSRESRTGHGPCLTRSIARSSPRIISTPNSAPMTPRVNVRRHVAARPSLFWLAAGHSAWWVVPVSRRAGRAHCTRAGAAKAARSYGVVRIGLPERRGRPGARRGVLVHVLRRRRRRGGGGYVHDDGPHFVRFVRGRAPLAERRPQRRPRRRRDQRGRACRAAGAVRVRAVDDEEDEGGVYGLGRGG